MTGLGYSSSRLATVHQAGRSTQHITRHLKERDDGESRQDSTRHLRNHGKHRLTDITGNIAGQSATSSHRHE